MASKDPRTERDVKEGTMTQHSSRGFTLIEVLVVVVIIIIVSTVAFAFYGVSPERKKLNITAKELFSQIQDARFLAINSGLPVLVVGIGDPLKTVLTGRDQNGDGTLTPPDSNGASPDYIRKVTTIPTLMRSDPSQPTKKLGTLQIDNRGMIRTVGGLVAVVDLEFCEVTEETPNVCVTGAWHYKLMTSPIGLPREE